MTLRAVTREDLDRLAGFANDLEVEHAGGGDPPVPRLFERIVKDFERAIRAYSSRGFVEEGRMREHAWLGGRHVDNIVMGVVREEWAEE